MESNNIKTIRITSSKSKSQRSKKQVDLYDISGHFTPKGACITSPHEFNDYDSPKNLHMMHVSRIKREHKPLVLPQQIMENKSHLRYD